LGNRYGGGTVVGECPLASAGWLKFGRLEFVYIIEKSATQYQQMLHLVRNEPETNNLLLQSQGSVLLTQKFITNFNPYTQLFLYYQILLPED
jgi:hypothetical protein